MICSPRTPSCDRKLTSKKNLPMLIAQLEAVCVFSCIGLQVCLCLCVYVYMFEFIPLLWLKCEFIKDVAWGLVFYCVFWHFYTLSKLFFPPLAFSPFYSVLPGCLRDVWFNSHRISLDGEQLSEDLHVVTSQGVSVGCSSEACRKHHCSPPLVCVDLWRHHECRFCENTQWITSQEK